MKTRYTVTAEYYCEECREDDSWDFGPVVAGSPAEAITTVENAVYDQIIQSHSPEDEIFWDAHETEAA
jgi:hypothetical protein